ncbi:MAG: 2-amino-4-hydroxy-6-hydroxymethyldihydropteridine diphosphokinase [Planctomycetes bacterium]|nr:2-amino-4-hydroxy-6-hydroxymethyldihydropteridine diphosphokinase [Planctomycetota bacterium]
MITAYIALGSNLGDKQQNIKIAIRSIKQIKDTRVTGVSGIYRTPAEGNIQQPNYINAVIEMKTSLSAIALLKESSRIEKTLGRVRINDRLLPRTIDLDILLYGQKIYRLPHLTIPHPRMHKRRFVLEPLCELAPELMHPVLNKPICALLKKL